MNEIFKDMTSVAMAIVGVAILAVIVSRNNNTQGVIQSSAQGFGSVLGVAMGGASNMPVSSYGVGVP